MTLYVESNFVLEIALGQEEAEQADRLLAAAEKGAIEIALPTFALSEPFSTITGRARNRKQLIGQLNTHVEQLARSSPHQQDVASLQPMPDIMARIDKREANRLMTTIERLLGTARRIDIDLAVFRESVAITSRFDLQAQDAIILAAVLADLRIQADQGPHVFANRNRKDFDIPGIHGDVGALNCTVLFSFAETGKQLGLW